MESSVAKDANVVAVTKEVGLAKVAVTKEVGQVPATVKVVDVATRAAADLRVKVADAAMKVIHGRLDESKKRARQVWQDWNDLINELAAPWEKDKEFHVDQVKKFDREEKKKLEMLQRQAEEAAKILAEEKQLAEAEAAAAAGDMKAAEAIIEEPVVPVVPVLKSDLPKLDARKYQTRWKARVTDKYALILHVADMIRKGRELKSGSAAEGAAYAEWANALDPNDSFLNQKAKAQEDKLSIPGVVAYES
jgi:hypothetical protein